MIDTDNEADWERKDDNIGADTPNWPPGHAVRRRQAARGGVGALVVTA